MRERFLNLLYAERERWVLFLPILLAAGALLYFALHKEPPAGRGLVLCVALAFSAIGFRRRPVIRNLTLLLLLSAIGFTAAQWRTANVAAPVLAQTVQHASITGRIVEVATTEKGSKLRLSDVSIEGIAPEATPLQVSVSLKKYDERLRAGQFVRVRGGLFPPPEPAYPGGFDFSRHFYFKRIGAVGYGIPPVEILSAEPSTSLWLSDFRYRLNERLRKVIAPTEGAIAQALVTGESRAIPENVNESMRVAGLYHLLAVSGMNLVLVSGVFFFAVRFLIALIPPLALRISGKKWAAAVALIGTFFYLLIADSPVSAERAFVMVALFLGAVLLDRDVTPMRSLMLAASLIILIQPESIVGAGFHLSFAATIGLIAFFEWCHTLWERQEFEPSFFWRVRFYLLTVFATSLVAGLATTPYAIFHFQKFSTYGLLANMLAIPIISFLVMPMLVLSVFLMPFGLEAWTMQPVGWGIELMVIIADWVSGLPHAILRPPPISDWGLVMITLGGLWLCLWQKRWRLLGLIPILIGMLSMSDFEMPIALVSADGKNVALRNEMNEWVLAKGRQGTMLVDQWQEYTGIEKFHLRKDKVSGFHCDKEGCQMQGPPAITVSDSQAVLAEDCLTSDLVISAKDLSGCAVPHIGEWELRLGGAHAIWAEKNGLRGRTARGVQGRRSWTGMVVTK